MKRLLIFCDWFRPGYKAGGPITSLANLTLSLRGKMDIYIFTSDRDLGDHGPYRGIVRDQWVYWNGAKVFYARPSMQKVAYIRKMIMDLSPDCIYLNSMFSRYFTVYPILAMQSLNFRGKLVLSPRGMLRSSAVKIKRTKKMVFIKALKTSGFISKVFFHATDEQEAQDIRSFFGTESQVVRIPNMSTPPSGFKAPIPKSPGSVRFIFVGRIHPIKNLYFLLECLMRCRVNVSLSLVGSIDDESYWQKCKALIAQLPEGIVVEHVQGANNEGVKELINEHHFFVLPTTGENFGHAIFEAMLSSRPVLISDQTPWRGLEGQKAGWDLPLSDADAFVEVINRAGDMQMSELESWAEGAYSFSVRHADAGNMTEGYLDLFS
jgi:glycosyltransferase involved in cell wall biosynthesis